MAAKKNESYEGFIASFEPARSKKLTKLIEFGSDFSDSFSIDDWDLQRKEIFFLILNRRPPEITAAAFVERSYGNGGTGKPKYSFSHTVSFDPPIPLQELENQISNIQGAISNSARGGRRLDTDTWKKLLAYIEAKRPDSVEKLRSLLALIDKEADLLDDTNRIQRLAEQRDAIGIALDIAGCDRTFTMRSIDAEKAYDADSILDMIEDLPTAERSLVEHDADLIRKMLGSDPDEVKASQIAIEGERKVAVYVADKTNLETALGTDLLIYQKIFKSFILIQYKLMRRPAKNGSADAVTDGSWYYIPDSQFNQQMTTIENIRGHILEPQHEDGLWDFRLNSDPFYFKFCEKRKYYAREESLVRGLNITATHLKRFLETTDSEPKRIGYATCPRYLNNTEFISLARAGWIGSSYNSTEFIAQVLEANRQGGRASMMAIINVPKLTTAELRKPR